MTVIAFVPEAKDASLVVAWATTLAEPDEPVEYICLSGRGDREGESEVVSQLEKEGVPNENVKSVSRTGPVAEVLDACRKSKSRLLITAGFSMAKAGRRPQTALELIRAAPCMTIAPLYGKKGPSEIKRILTIVIPDHLGVATLRLTDMIRKKLNAEATAATVEDESGTKAERAGEKAVRSLLNDAGLDEEDFAIKVAVDRLRHRGILTCLEDHQAIVCGLSTFADVSPLHHSVGDATTIVVKRSPPLRLRSLTDWLPRISPRDHAELLQDLRSGSRWNGDFVSMLALAAAIASLGLMQNSPAVVIGSMLLAPMMTPMIGAGLALAQANLALAKQCGKTILLGFLLTIAVSFLLGMTTPSRETLSPEVLSRGEPNVLDLLIAFFAAIAATIAMSRPSISGAIAGVAIATAIVPPLCAVGLSFSHGSFDNGLGALLLFCTNLVAIVVASTFTFTLLGIMTVQARRQHVVWFSKIMLILVLAVLAGPLSQKLLTQLHQGREQTALYPVTRAVARALASHTDKDPEVDITLMGRSSVFDGVIIHIASRKELPESYAVELRSIVRREMERPDMKVYVVCIRGQWLNTGLEGLNGGQEASLTDPFE